jgi:hypothetical protein
MSRYKKLISCEYRSYSASLSRRPDICKHQNWEIPNDKTGIRVDDQRAGSTVPDPETDPQLSCLFEIQIRFNDTDPDPGAMKLAKNNTLKKLKFKKEKDYWFSPIFWQNLDPKPHKVNWSFLLASWRSMTKMAGSGSGSTPICHRSGTLHTALGGEFCGELLHAGLALPRPLHQHLRLGLLLLQLSLQGRDSTTIKKSR